MEMRISCSLMKSPILFEPPPAKDWQSFIQWAKDRAVAYRPLQIATVKGSIQEVIFRFALKDAGIPVNVVSA
jgi:hypothetical protein